ncbi:propionate catabolism operon regulatory protein PrpR [Pseudomonas umsongensis]|jgi:propionate catabolism operon transcriptional regulator|uniref:propionate catabolism operon regulatory protein PrpR n=1 Tax=Pseudomonas umsongensis TaxID=198618 RepID=UPI00200AF60C|nr:propionate catabolism operon regulatory protein PrpR [Pseudomonas umsongensis]MCK8659223.1 propionate catabolism operon regulatory protein PrpR [Pseudomonas umsongensis]
MPPRLPRIIVLISHLQRPLQQSRLARVVTSVLPDYSGETDIRVLDTTVEESLQLARELEQNGEVEVFVCAGATAAYLRRHLSRPVLSMRVGGADLLWALEQARLHSPQIAVISHARINADLDSLAALFTVQIHQGCYITLDEARQAVERARHLGCQTVIGSSTVVELAEQVGLHGVLSISQTTVRKALEEALGILHSQRSELAKRRHLDAVLQHIPSGVAAVDNQGIVQALNPAFEALLGMPASRLLGRPLQEFCPQLALDEVLRSGVGEENTVIQLGQNLLVCNILPILEDGQRTGLVLTCQDTSAVQRADQRIRSTHRPGGFSARYRLEQISGKSPATRQLLKLAQRYGATSSTVLITGESGTGKELLAQGMHNVSNRQGGPFVAINCAAFPESLLESELFGYQEGAFSGSRKGGKPGLIEAAHGGTMFLDEIGDMPVSLQTRLLRVLQEREVLRLGATEPISIDIRIIAATHQDLPQAIEAGRFRSDLYYRLNILRLQTVPLRERSEDIGDIARAILRRLNGEHRVPPLQERLLESLLPHLMAYHWPGNIRELENILERAALSAEDLLRGTAIEGASLALVIPELRNSRALPPTVPVTDLKSIAKEKERQYVLDMLQACDGNLAQTASRLGISRSTLWRRLQ